MKKRKVTRSNSNGVKSKRKTVTTKGGLKKNTYKAKSKSGKSKIKTISKGGSAVQMRKTNGNKTYRVMSKSGMPNVSKTKNVSKSRYKKAKRTLKRK